MILAVDANCSSTGLAFGGENDSSPKGGLLHLPGSGAALARTLGEIRNSITGLCKMTGARWCAVEAPLEIIDWKHSRASLMALVQLTGAVRAGIQNAGCEEMLCPIDAVRRSFIGTARLSTDEAEIAIKKRCDMLGWDYDGSHDRADACATWFYAMALKYPQWQPSVRKFR